MKRDCEATRGNESRVTTVNFFFSSRRRHTRLQGDWSSDVCSSDLTAQVAGWIRTGSRLAAYDWARADKTCLPWNRWNAEQQAQCVSDFNLALERGKIGRASCRERV